MEMGCWIRIPKDLVEYLKEWGFTTVEFTTKPDFSDRQRWCVLFRNCTLGVKLLIDLGLMEEKIEAIGLIPWIDSFKKDVDDYFRMRRYEHFDHFIVPGIEEWDERLT